MNKPRIQQNAMSRTTPMFMQKSHQDLKKVVDVSIPFIFPYIVGSDNNSQSKTQNSSTTNDQSNKFTNKDFMNSSLTQSRFFTSPTTLNKINSNMSNNNNKGQRQSISSNKQKGPQNRKIIKGSCVVKNDSNFLKYKRRNANILQNISVTQFTQSDLPAIEDFQPIKQRIIPNSVNKRNTFSSDSLHFDFDKQKNDSKQNKEKNANKKQLKQNKFNKVRNSTFTKFQSRPSNIKFSLLPTAKKFVNTNSITSNTTSQKQISVVQQFEKTPKKNLSRFSLVRRNTSVSKFSKNNMFRSSFIKPSQPSLRISQNWNSFVSNQSSAMNLIQQQKFNTLTVIDQDDNFENKQKKTSFIRSSKPNTSIIHKVKNRVTINNIIQPRLSNVSRLSKIKKQNKTILKNKKQYEISLGLFNEQDDIPTIQAKNIVITQRKQHPSRGHNKSSKTIKSTKSTKSIKSIKSNKSFNKLGSESRCTSESNFQPDIGQLLRPNQTNKVYKYLNHLIKRNNLLHQQQISSSESIPSLTNIDFFRKRVETKNKLDQDLIIIKNLQDINSQTSESKYEIFYQILSQNENNDLLMLQRNAQFKNQTNLLKVTWKNKENIHLLTQKQLKILAQ